jgi:O-antigen/teichoic acid export membrane protein/Ser/Thr protein kinase RdoA (MazF antagonist)
MKYEPSRKGKRYVKRLVQLLFQAKENYVTDSLFRNATLLMASTAIMSVLGFFFWVFVAHLYSPSMIGEASVLISVATLISNVSLLGLNSGLVRFLPSSKNQSRDINASLITVALMTVAASCAYLLIASLFGIHISLLSTPVNQFAFVVLMSTVSLNSLTDAVFIANRRAEFHTIGYTTFAVVKLILPLFLIPLGSLGIFLAYILAVIVSLLISLFFMSRYFGYIFGARPSWELLKKARKYATNNYIGIILAGLPSQLMPLFIIRELGSAQVAYFSMAWTIANLLYVIPSAAAQSLLAESSHDTSKKNHHIKRTIKLLTVTLIPVVSLAILIAPYVLRIFGGQYSVESTLIFQLFAFSTIFMAINTVGSAVLNIEHRTSGIVIIQVVAGVVTFVAASLLVGRGLAGVGGAMLLGSISTSICLYFVFRYNRKHPLVVAGEVGNAETFNATHNNLATALAPYGIRSFTFLKLHNGSSSYTFLVKENSSVVVLRIYRQGKKSDRQIRDEFAFTNFLSAKGLKVPQVIRNLNGQILSRANIEQTSWQAVLMSYEKGQHPKRYTMALLNHMAQSHAKLHMFGHNYAQNKRPAIQKAVGGQRQKRLDSCLILAPRGLSHFDFDASNILVDGSTMTILDFEGMRYGPLVTCLFFTLTQIYDLQSSVKDLRYYLAAYTRIRPLSIPEKFILKLALAVRYRSPKLLFV